MRHHLSVHRWSLNLSTNGLKHLLLVYPVPWPLVGGVGVEEGEQVEGEAEESDRHGDITAP